ncbi:MAG: hypothetical protein ACRCXT_12495 [Paraclostridium sp.]
MIKRIFNKNKANDLIKMGNVLKKVEVDNKNAGKLIFIFELNKKLIHDMGVLNSIHNK